MCGIAGFCRFGEGGEDPAPILHRMNRALAHRGPDGVGTYVKDGVGLAHTRLAVIDVACGAQPIVSADGLTAIVLNGEIYNHDALRREMTAQGRAFRTHSDTEVVLQLYESMGEACVERLRGMFAFAIWDRRRRSLFLVRDRIGIKPLYYRWTGDLLVFGSELKAILEYPGTPRVVDERGLDDYFTLGYVPSPRTILAGIEKLEAGQAVTVTREGLTRRRYWDLDFTPSREPRRDELPREVGRLLEDAVASELGSEVPVGTLLSGGIDSTAVLAFMAGRFEAGVPAFTATFSGDSDPDRSYSLLAADAFGAPWHEIPVGEPSPELLDRLAWHFDEPFADPSAIPTFAVCEEARRHVTVCLSGDGGDESFGGYRRYRDEAARRAVRQLVPESHASTVLEAAAALAPHGSWVPKPLRFRSLLRGAARTSMETYWNETAISDHDQRRDLYAASYRAALSGRDPFALLEEYPGFSKPWDPTSRLQYADFKTYLADGILTKVDRSSMAHGLEVRVPLLDHQLVEFIASVPSSRKVSWGQGKGLLKASLRGVVPRPILDRKKHGFTPPVGRWFEGPMGTRFEEQVLAGSPFVSGFLDMDSLRRVWRDQRAGARTATRLLWAILVLEAWARRFQ
jgi:asparagine synthase (glutamine-hydrolysing)